MPKKEIKKGAGSSCSSSESVKERTYALDITEKDDGKEVLVKGWIHEVRDLGKLKFLIIRDVSGIIQLVAHKEKTDKKLFDELCKVYREACVEVTGKVKASKQAVGGREIVPEKFAIIANAEPVLPIDTSDFSKTDIAKRLDYRFLDTRRKSISPIFKIRSKIVKNLVGFFDSNKFININTPKLTRLGLESGAELFQVMYFGKPAFLAQSPQLYKQMFVAGGFERVYEIGPVFRAEKSHTTRHMTEFTGVDFEMGFIKDENDVMDMVENMLKCLIENIKNECKEELKILNVELKVPEKIPRIDIQEIRKMLAKEGKKLKEDDDLDSEAEEMIGKIVLDKYKSEFVFATNYPAAKRPFYHMRPENDKKGTRSFDLIWKGVEIATGAQREHRFDVLEKQAKEKGIKLDPVYAEIFKYGCPPHGGVGFGLDRITQRMLNLENVREAILLPRDPERITP